MPKLSQNDDGQPAKALYYPRLIDRQITEMIGLARGIICDGVVADGEVVALRQWLKMNSEVTSHYPGNQLAVRVVRALEDGVIQDDERQELREFLFGMVGEPEDLTGTMRDPTTLPIDDPLPTLVFDAQEYVFTGILASGTRKWAMKQVADRGGICGDNVTKRTNVLVVGVMASEAWIQSTHGRKIQYAVSLRSAGQRISIVPEKHWLEAIEYDAH